MPVRFDDQEFATALRQLKPARARTSSNTASSEPLAADEWQLSEKFKLRLISARTKLKLMRDRSDALNESLRRFRSQQGNVNRA
jgi:hypothetical protein